jgi:rod shape-determining protein MreC
MNVIAGGGLVGRITSVGPNWSRVTSIISDNSNVSGMTLGIGRPAAYGAGSHFL